MARWRRPDGSWPATPHAVQLPQPLAVGNVAFAPTHVVHVTGVDQQHLEAALLEHLINRNPVDSSRFHRHGLDPALRKPVCQPLQVGGEGAKLAHRLRVAVRRDCHAVAVLSAVDPGRVGLNAFEQRDSARPLLPATPAFWVVLHLPALHIVGLAEGAADRGAKRMGNLSNGITPV